MSQHEHVPRRLIALPADVETFKRTVAYRDIVGFIMTLNEAVKNAAIPDEYPESELHAPVIALVAWLDSLIAMVKQVPLEKSQPGRFGNVAFRTWLECAVVNSREFLHSKLGLSDAYADELQGYVDESFGNKTRIDYGTGHELNFVAFLCCLSKLGLLGITDAQVIVFHIFNRYLALMRELQLYFMLEPAGSRGVWGLDDFQFMPFLWGSSQLLNSNLPPSSITRPDIVAQNAKSNLYFGAIQFIFKSKRGLFAEHSPMLNDISALPEWRKVNSGLIKMYHAEVLHKFVVVQHFLFGTILPFEPVPAPTAKPTQQSTGVEH